MVTYDTALSDSGDVLHNLAKMLPADSVCLSIPSDMRYVGLVRRVVKAAADAAGLSGQAGYDAVLATHEACANIIEHGYEGQPNQRLILTCRPTVAGLEVLLRDQAKKLDLDAIGGRPPDELRARGRGVWLIRHLMDEVAMLNEPHFVNTLRLFKRRDSATPAANH